MKVQCTLSGNKIPYKIFFPGIKYWLRTGCSAHHSDIVSELGNNEITKEKEQCKLVILG